MAELDRAAQRLGNGEHLLHRTLDVAALVAHMDAKRNVGPGKRRKGFDQALCIIEAIRRIAQTQRHAERPFAKRPLHAGMDGAKLIAVQLACGKARHIRPDHTGAGKQAHMDGQRKLPHRRAVGRHRFCRHAARADDRAEVLQNPGAVGRAEGRGRHAAVAVDDGGQALAQLQLAEAGAKHGQISVAVDIQKARGYGAAGRVDLARGPGRDVGRHGGDASVFDGNIRKKGRRAGAI